MTQIRSQIAELASLLQIYILQEHGMKEWLYAAAENHAFFKQRVLQTKKSPARILPSSQKMIQPAPPLPSPVPAAASQPAAEVKQVPISSEPAASEASKRRKN